MEMLKMIILGAGIATLLASSARAQSYQPEWGSGNIVPDANAPPYGATVSEPYLGPLGARAFAPDRGYARGYAPDSYAYQPAPRHHLHEHTMQGHSDMDRQ
jgi:hypothetical protein